MQICSKQICAGIQLPWMAIHIRHTEFNRHIHPCSLDPGNPCRDDGSFVVSYIVTKGQCRSKPNSINYSQTHQRPSFRQGLPETSCHGWQYTFATLNSIDTYIPVVLIPAIPAGMTDLLCFLHRYERTTQIKTQP